MDLRTNEIIIFSLNRLVLSTLLAVTFNLSYGQGFQKTFGHPNNSNVNAIISTHDGGYALFGAYDVLGLFSAEMNLIKTDSIGTLEWSYTYGEKKDPVAKKDGSGNGGYGLIQTRDSGYLLTGETHGFGSGIADTYIVKVDNTGDTVWSRAYGGQREDYGYVGLETYRGNYLIAGYTESFGAGIRDGYLLYLNEHGDTIWTRTIGTSGLDGLFDVCQTKDSNFVVLGHSLISGNSDIFLTKMDRTGRAIWSYSYGGDENDFGYSLQKTKDGGFIIAGNTESFGQGVQDAYVLKTDSSGKLLWSKVYGGADYESFNSIREMEDGRLIASGYTSSFGFGNDDIYGVFLNQNGDTIWTRCYGGNANDASRSVEALPNGFVIGGTSSSFGFGYNDMYLIRTDANGNSGCHQTSTKTVVETLNSFQDSIFLGVNSGAVVTKTPTIIGKTQTGRKYPCETVSTSTKPEEESAPIIYPNPCRSVLNITNPGQTSKSLSIYNSSGVMVAQKQITSYTQSIPVSGLIPGVYTCRIEAHNTAHTIRFIKY